VGCLELFHGPTLAFKDFGGRFMAQMLTHIAVDMATEFMTKIAGLEGYQPADAANLADQQVKGLAAMGQMFRITTLACSGTTASRLRQRPQRR
ncbi:hypothetical protein FK513_32130, partial [Klebsiella pneumoniae]|nr:hypothetical protein [Klebsiella pneumoniae]